MGVLKSAESLASAKRLKKKLDLGKNMLDPMIPTGDIEVDDREELQIVKNTLALAEQKMAQTVGMGYSATLVFSCEAQLESFMKAAGWGEFRDESGAFIDGIGLAKHLGIAIQKDRVRVLGRRKDKSLS